MGWNKTQTLTHGMLSRYADLPHSHRLDAGQHVAQFIPAWSGMGMEWSLVLPGKLRLERQEEFNSNKLSFKVEIKSGKHSGKEPMCWPVSPPPVAAQSTS